eukprot:scaffold18360_cov114-Isochrysis_galbana.AAC.2
MSHARASHSRIARWTTSAAAAASGAYSAAHSAAGRLEATRRTARAAGWRRPPSAERATGASSAPLVTPIRKRTPATSMARVFSFCACVLFQTCKEEARRVTGGGCRRTADAATRSGRQFYCCTRGEPGVASGALMVVAPTWPA